MPEDPNTKMDELLRKYAEERRKVADPQMHPATRKMLQGEVSRVYPRSSGGEGWLGKMRSFWPQYAIGLAAVIVLLGLIIPGQLSKAKLNSRKTVVSDAESDRAVKESIAPAAPSERKDLGQEVQLKNEAADKKAVRELAEDNRSALSASAERGTSMRGLVGEPALKPDSVKQGENEMLLNSIPVNGQKGERALAEAPVELRKQEESKSLANAPTARDESSIYKFGGQGGAEPVGAVAEKRKLSLAAIQKAAELNNLGMRCGQNLCRCRRIIRY